MEPLLLVEDKNELRAMLRKALERAGYEVDEAPDGPSAIQKVRARRYLLVITDLKMPGASGLDVLRETKQADSTIPVLLLTAFGSVDEAVTAMKEGAFDFLQKPVDLEHLKLARRPRRSPAGAAPRKSDPSRRIFLPLRFPAHPRRSRLHPRSQPADSKSQRHRFHRAAPR